MNIRRPIRLPPAALLFLLLLLPAMTGCATNAAANARRYDLPPMREQIARYVDAGFTKLVVRPADPPAEWGPELRRLADDVLDLQT